MSNLVVIVFSLKNRAKCLHFGAEGSSGSTIAEGFNGFDDNCQKTYYSSGVISAAGDDIRKISLSGNLDAAVALGNVVVTIQTLIDCGVTVSVQSGLRDRASH